MKIIIDCDPGNGIPGANVDDAIALMYALRHPDLEVEAIWTVFGNTSAAEGEASALQLLTELGVRDVPVLRGSDQPLSGARDELRAKLDAPSRDPEVCRFWGRSEPPRRCLSDLTDDPIPALAADLLSSVDDVVLVCLGPLTNPARLLAEAPEAMTRVTRIALMGGHLAADGEVDTNFAVDPQAAARVLASDIPLTIVPLDVTRTTELSGERWRQIVVRGGGNVSPAIDNVSRWLEPWLEYSRRTRPVDGMWLHDLVVVAALIEPETVVRAARRVSIADSPAGKLTIDEHGVSVDLVTAVDNSELLAGLERAVARAGSHSLAEPQTQTRGTGREHEGPEGGEQARDPSALLHEPHGLDARRREGRVSAEEPGADDEMP